MCLFQWSPCGSIDRLLLNYHKHCTAQAHSITLAITESDPDEFTDLPNLPILATFKTITGTLNPLEWMGGPYILPCEFLGYEFVRARRFKKVPSVLLFGVAALTTDRVALTQVLEMVDPELNLVYTFEAATTIITFKAKQILDGLANGSDGHKELEYFFEQLDQQHSLRQDLKDAYRKNTKGTAGK